MINEGLQNIYLSIKDSKIDQVVAQISQKYIKISLI